MTERVKRAATLEKLYPGRGSLYERYLVGPLREIGGEYANAVEERLLNGERKLDQQVLTELKSRSDRARQGVHVSVDTARWHLESYFDNVGFRNTLMGRVTREAFTQLGYSLIVYGSLQYGDPVNWDVDLLAVAEKKTDSLESLQVLKEKVREDLVPYWTQFPIGDWKSPRRGDPHFETLALSDFDDPVQALENYLADQRNPNPHNLAPVISGVALFKKDGHRVSSILHERAKMIAESDPLICAIVNTELRGCLDIRRERENQPRPSK